jgi:hypothetical protein
MRKVELRKKRAISQNSHFPTYRVGRAHTLCADKSLETLALRGSFRES